jgi:hypothetical protein
MQFDPAHSTIVADLGALFAAIDVLSGIACHDNQPRCGAAYRAPGLDPDAARQSTPSKCLAWSDRYCVRASAQWPQLHSSRSSSSRNCAVCSGVMTNGSAP